jgi:hypothetical protein
MWSDVRSMEVVSEGLNTLGRALGATAGPPLVLACCVINSVKTVVEGHLVQEPPEYLAPLAYLAAASSSARATAGAIGALRCATWPWKTAVTRFPGADGGDLLAQAAH